MSLRLRNIQIRVATEAGTVGADVEFKDGLNVIAAPNTSGKSTCVMAALYALGLEGMLGPTHNPPLADAVLTALMIDGKEVSVVGSQVRLQIENHEKKSLTLQRAIVGPNIDRHLIRCVMGPDLSAPSADYDRRDFYVRLAGSAQNKSGFHRYLAEFMGYDLPRVPGIETESLPLYLECLFPFFFVDQLSGWRDIKSRMPTYLRIPEMSKRATEYILSLDVLNRAIERKKLELQLDEIKERWGKELATIRAEFGEHSVVIRGFPDEPVALWPLTPLAQILITDGDNWITLEQALANVRSRQVTIVEEEIPKAEEVSQQVIEELQTTEEKLDQMTRRLERATKEATIERSQITSINKRLVGLNEDYREYHDLRKILDRGGEVPLTIADSVCPYCKQDIKDVLLPQDSPATPMTLEENIAFLKDQIATFSAMRRDSVDILEAKDRQVSAIQEKIRDLSSQVRALKRTLHSDGRVPSFSAVREHLQLDEAATLYQAIIERFEAFLKRAEELVKEWVKVTGKLNSLADITLSDMDRKKIQGIAKSFIEQLGEYNFGSFLIDQVSISEETYRPSRKGFDIGVVSASDTIRIIWAYLIAFLEVSRTFPTNHAGLLVFDEPRQQGAEQVSFDALLIRASTSLAAGQQVIVATSEEKPALEPILKDIPHTYIPFYEKILRHVS